MKTEVIICDHGRVRDTFGGSCRRLSDASCCICEGDFCYEHLPGRLALMIGLQRDAPATNGNPATTTTIASVNNTALASTPPRICRSCWEHLDNSHAVRVSIEAEFREALPTDKAVQIIKAAISAAALTRK